MWKPCYFGFWEKIVSRETKIKKTKKIHKLQKCADK